MLDTEKLEPEVLKEIVSKSADIRTSDRSRSPRCALITAINAHQETCGLKNRDKMALAMELEILLSQELKRRAQEKKNLPDPHKWIKGGLALSGARGNENLHQHRCD